MENPRSLREPQTLGSPQTPVKEAPLAPTLAASTTQSPGLTRSFSWAHDTLELGKTWEIMCCHPVVRSPPAPHPPKKPPWTHSVKTKAITTLVLTVARGGSKNAIAKAWMLSGGKAMAVNTRVAEPVHWFAAAFQPGE